MDIAEAVLKVRLDDTNLRVLTGKQYSDTCYNQVTRDLINACVALKTTLSIIPLEDKGQIQQIACFCARLQLIQIYNKSYFSTIDDFNMALAHELGHAIGSPRHLKRKTSYERYSALYCKEELVAECFALKVGLRARVSARAIKRSLLYLRHFLSLIPQFTMEDIRYAEKQADLSLAYLRDILSKSEYLTKGGA